MARHRTRPVRWLATLLIACTVGLPSGAAAQPRTTTVRITATVDEAPSVDRARATWRLRVHREDVTLFVSQLQILAGATTDAEIFRQLRANRAAIVTSGQAAGLKVLTEARKGAAVRITGTLRWTETPPVLMVSTAELE